MRVFTVCESNKAEIRIVVKKLSLLQLAPLSPIMLTLHEHFALRYRQANIIPNHVLFSWKMKKAKSKLNG